MSTFFYQYLVGWVLPSIRWKRYQVPGNVFSEFKRVVQSGDIVLTKTKGKLVSQIVPGAYAHAALCIADGRHLRFAEMSHYNYAEIDAVSLVGEVTSICVLKIVDMDEAYLEAMIDECRCFSDRKYDKQFQHGCDALYCSELIYESDFEKRIGASAEDLVGLGTPYVSPMGLRDASGVRVVMEWHLK
jgi:hypothetical protein